MGIKRGDVVIIDINVGHQDIFDNVYTGKRPAVVLQNNIGNANSPITIVALVTSADKKVYPMHQKIQLTRPSLIMYEQILTINQEAIEATVARLSPKELEEMNEKLSISLGIPSLAPAVIKAVEFSKRTEVKTKKGTEASIGLTVFLENSVEELELPEASMLEYLGHPEWDNSNADNIIADMEAKLNSLQGAHFLYPYL